jgi:hypothetical protein
VYCKPPDLFGALDDYVEDSEELRTPLVVLGESGSGMSALVSNWLQSYKRRSKARGMDVFNFYHAVGCTRQSMNRNSMIRRLMENLKTKFELNREVPVEAEKLAWDLPLFLEKASRKGKVLLILDGLHRLGAEDSEDSVRMTWLPLQFPPNVRVILTVSVPSIFLLSERDLEALDSTTKRPRIWAELKRRNWQELQIGSTEHSFSRGIIELYMRRSVQTDSALVATGAFKGHQDTEASSTGLLLFPGQVDAIVSHSLGSRPVFLRLMLRMLWWACQAGFCAWTLLDKWLGADDIEDLLVRILHTAELGHRSSSQSLQTCKDRCRHAGGSPAMWAAHPWHPMKQESNVDLDSQLSADFKSFTERANLLSIAKQGNNDDAAGADGRKTGADEKKNQLLVDNGNDAKNSILYSMGDQVWRARSDKAEATLELSNIDMIRRLEEFVSQVKQGGDGDVAVAPPNSAASAYAAGSDYIGSLMELMERAAAHEQRIVDPSELEPGLDVHREDTDDESEGDDENEEEPEDMELVADDPALSTLAQQEAGVPHGGRGTGDPNGTSSLDGLLSSGTGSVLSGVDENSAVMASALVSGGASSSGASGSLGFGGPDGMADRERSTARSSSAMMRGTHRRKEDVPLTELPQYLLGGSSVVKGLGELLGHALALLYVARHGLTLDELWAILASIYNENEASALEASAVQDNRVLIAVCYGYRGALEDFWRSADAKQSGRLSYKALLQGMKKVNAQFDRSDLNLLLEVADMGRSAWGTQTGGSVKIPYLELIARIERVERGHRAADNRTKVAASKQKTAATGGGGGLDDMSVPSLTGASLYDDFDNRSGLGGLGGGELSGVGAAADSAGKGGGFTIGPIMEEALLSMLRAVGVLFSAENKVLVMSHDSEALRRVVYNKYISCETKNGISSEDVDSALLATADRSPGPTTSTGEAGGSRLGSRPDTSKTAEGRQPLRPATAAESEEEEQRKVKELHRWHTRLIVYFQHQPNTLRRCEELLWHLKICRKWHTLKDTVADLKTFDLMYMGEIKELKEEFIHYWSMLTEGPLFTTNSAQKAYQANRQMQRDNQKILVDLDTAAALGLTEKEARKQLMKSQISCFDIVEEFFKSVEYWSQTSKPTITSMAQRVEKIAVFMAEFSQKSSNLPAFLRLKMDMDVLKRDFGTSFSLMEKTSLEQDEGGDKSDNVGDTAGADEENDLRLVPATSLTGVASLTPESGHENRFYYYRRWLWAQFPLLALCHASARAREEFQRLTSAGGTSKTGSVGNGLGGSMSLSATSGEIPKSSRSDSTEGTVALLQDATERSTAVTMDMLTKAQTDMTFRKNFEIKKRDPTVEPHFTVLPARLNAFIRNSVTSATDLNTLSNMTTRIRDSIENEAQKPPHKFKRTLEEDGKLFASIPFSQHTVRVQKHKTKFPSIDAMMRQAQEKKDGDELLTPQEIARLGQVCTLVSLFVSRVLYLLSRIVSFSTMTSLVAHHISLSTHFLTHFSI